MLTATDLFCGAGGSSIGLEDAGVQLVMAANHWQLAVNSHQKNFPGSDHDCADISQTDPRRYPATDILWSSPECTNHSQAKRHKHAQRDLAPTNGRPLPVEAEERSRATMWDVPRFAEAMDMRGTPYRGIIVENVIEAAKWVLFEPWLQAMHALGYEHKIVCLNSAFASDYATIDPAPQFRERLYIVFTRAGDRVPELDFRPSALCPEHGYVNAVQTFKRRGNVVGRYRSQYTYNCPKCHVALEPEIVPAAAAIDWSIEAQRIGDRVKPLADGTMRRIAAGVEKCGEQPLLVPVDRLKYWASKTARTTDVPFLTQTARSSVGVAIPNDAFIASLRGGGFKLAGGTQGVGVPLTTVTASGNHHMLVRLPRGFMMRNNGSHGRAGAEHCTPFNEPVRTITTKGHQSVVTSPTPNLDDCTFRMLEPHEIGAAMAFPTTYEVLGNKREKVKQYGNGVTPPAARLIISALTEAITGERAVAA